MTNPGHALLNGIERLCGECSHRSLHDTGIWNDIGCFARINLGYRHHCGINRFRLPRDQALKSLNQMTRNQDRVHTKVGHCRMRTFAADSDFKFITRGHHGTWVESKLTHP